MWPISESQERDFVLSELAFVTELACSFKFMKYVHWTDRQTDVLVHLMYNEKLNYK